MSFQAPVPPRFVKKFTPQPERNGLTANLTGFVPPEGSIVIGQTPDGNGAANIYEFEVRSVVEYQTSYECTLFTTHIEDINNIRPFSPGMILMVSFMPDTNNGTTSTSFSPRS